MELRIIEADLENPEHAEQIVTLTNAYAMDDMGGGKPLPEAVTKRLISGLKKTGTYVGFLAFNGTQAVGIINGFMGFSTFFAKPLINIHDIGVLPDARGQGVGKALIHAVTEKGKELDCCKVTLEVLHTNPARRLYEREGFEYGDPPYYFMNKYLQ